MNENELAKIVVDLGYKIYQIDEEIPEILVSDDIDLSVYVTPHVY